LVSFLVSRMSILGSCGMFVGGNYSDRKLSANAAK